MLLYKTDSNLYFWLIPKLPELAIRSQGDSEAIKSIGFLIENITESSLTFSITILSIFFLERTSSSITPKSSE